MIYKAKARIFESNNAKQKKLSILHIQPQKKSTTLDKLKMCKFAKFIQ